MGFEFQLVAVSGSTSNSWEDAGKCFASQVAPYAKATVGSTRRSAFNVAYEWIDLPPSTGLEDFVLVQDQDKCYVCFHRGADEQMASILNLLTSCYLTAGIIGSFEEL